MTQHACDSAPQSTPKKSRDVRDKLAEATRLYRRAVDLAQRHRSRAAKLLHRGERQGAAEAEAAAARNEHQARRWQNEVDRFRPMAQRADALERIGSRISAVAGTQQAAAAEPLPRTPGERRQLEKRASALLAANAATRTTYATAGVSWDPRTAAGRRELVVENLGHTRRAKASLDALFSRKTDATDVRIQTVERFDSLVHAASGGLFPFPKFEVEAPGKSRGEKISDGVDAHHQLSKLAGHIGQEAFALMWVRIIIRVRWTALEGEGIGAARSLSTQFLAAVDAAARFFDIDRSATMAAEIYRLFAKG